MTILETHWPSVLSGILALLAVEAAALAWRRPLPVERLASVVAGICLLVAWRVQLAGAPVAFIAAVLALAGICHALPWFVRGRADVRRRPGG